MMINSVDLSRIKFSGHDTFPLRLTWLPKAISGIIKNAKLLIDYYESMIKLGVGKNMAKSIRHWIDSSQLVEFSLRDRTHTINDNGKFLFSESGDPYLENQDTIWLLHYLICTNRYKNALWIYLFNYYTSDIVERDGFLNGVKHWCNENKIPVPSESTLNRDYLCCMNMYNASIHPSNYKSEIETYLMNPFKELRLISKSKYQSQYVLRKLNSQEISSKLISYTLARYIDKQNYPESINIDDLLCNPFSPGRIFRFTESVLVDYLKDFQRLSGDIYIYDSTAGIAQLLKNNKKKSQFDLLKMLKSIYSKNEKNS